MKKGSHHSEKTKRKISETEKGRKQFEETKIKISETKKSKGLHLSDEHKRKVSQAQKGKKVSLETRRKMSEANKGQNHYNWQGGKSREKYPPEWNKELKEFIKTRDNYLCQECFISESQLIIIKRRLHVHHIDYSKINSLHKNLISLCSTCHARAHFRQSNWIKRFHKKLKEAKKK